MGAKSRVGRPRKNTLRVELRLNLDDAAVKAIVREAQERGVALQEHITDILIARYLNKDVPAPEPPPATDAGSAMADEWM